MTDTGRKVTDMLLASLIWAQEGQGGGFFALLMPLGLLLIMWIFLIRGPMKRQEAERQAMIASLEKNDRVLTSSGIYGTVVSVGDGDEMLVKIDDNVKVKMSRAAVARNLTKEEKAREAQEAKKEGK